MFNFRCRNSASVLALVLLAGCGASPALDGGIKPLTGGGNGHGGGTAGGTSGAGGGASAAGGGNASAGGQAGASPGGGTPMGGGAGGASGGGASTVTLTINVIAAAPATGAVDISPGGVHCTGSCPIQLPERTVVSLYAASGPFSGPSTWSGPCAGSQDSCQFTLTTSTQIAVTFDRVNLVFATSTRVAPGALNGFAGADRICEALAADAGLWGLGSYRAWLSPGAGQSPLFRFDGGFGWMRTDGRPFAAGLPELNANMLYYPPLVDERGNNLAVHGTSIPVSQLAVTGEGGPDNCAEWTANLSQPTSGGIISGGAGAWNVGSTIRCDDLVHLYCFGGRYRSHVRLKPPVLGQARLGFLALEQVPPGMGLATMDRACTDVARDAGYPGSFRALISTTTASAASRFDAGGPLWVRPDGARLFDRAADVGLVPPRFATANQVTPKGNFSSTWVMTGGNAPAVGHTETCSDWTNNTSNQNFAFGIAHYSTGHAMEVDAGFLGSCGISGFPVYCLQE